MKNPIQPLEKDKHGIMRFKENKIVRLLFEKASEQGFDMNFICSQNFSQDDRVQFAQLIGYSLSGFSQLSYVDDETYGTASLMSEGKDPKDARIEVLEDQLKNARDGMRQAVADLYGVDSSFLEQNG